jgi:hypothetical protein
MITKIRFTETWIRTRQVKTVGFHKDFRIFRIRVNLLRLHILHNLLPEFRDKINLTRVKILTLQLVKYNLLRVKDRQFRDKIRRIRDNLNRIRDSLNRIRDKLSHIRDNPNPIQDKINHIRDKSGCWSTLPGTTTTQCSTDISGFIY